MNSRCVKFQHDYPISFISLNVGRFFWSWVKTLLKFRKRKRKSLRVVFTSSIKREIRHFHVVVVHWRQRNAQKSVMQVQSNPIAFLPFPFPLPSLSSLLKFSNGPYGEASLERGTFFRSEVYETVGICWSILKDREFCHFGRWKRPKGLTDSFFTVKKSRKRSVFFFVF